MIERCQKQYVRNTDRQFLYISIGVLLICIAIYYIFSFLCSPVVIFYVAGCVACVAVIKSEYVSNYLCILRLYFLCDHVTEESSEALAPKNGCDVCGEDTCSRHSEGMLHEPWAGVLIHKQLDQAIEDFYNTILNNFVSSWYNSISKNPFFLHELRTILRYASAALLRRASKINYANLITRKLMPCFLHHYTLYQEAQKMKARIPDLTLEQAALEGPLKFSLHAAVRSRDAELKYLRSVTEVIMPYLLQQSELQCSVFKILIKEIFAGWVLLSLTDVLADPYILNAIIILATNDAKIAPLPRTPSHRVEILENFVHMNGSVLTARGKLLNVELELLLNSQDYFYSFMQFMKINGNVHLLQFCKDIKIFNNKILKPDMSKNEEVSLFNEAWDLYIQYFVPESRISIAFDKAIVEEMRLVLSGGASCVKKLLTSKALYQSYDFVYNVLELNYVPTFLHTDEFYVMLCGPRIPTGFHKQSKKPLEKISAAAKLSSKLKTAFKTQIVDGQVLNSSDIKISTDNGTDADNLENMDILRYLDNLAEHTMLAERDLTYWRISIRHGEETMLNMKPTRIFTITVRRIDPMLPAEDTTWTVERLENDFHQLKAKLIEFHGENLFADVTTVSRRNNSPMEIIKYKYEGFLQQLLMKPLLRTSELLHLFLTEEGDFSLAVQQASLNAASGSDLVNMYQSVAQKLRKEKGQHLDPFMNAFLVSTDMERYQAMKNDAHKELDEAEEVSDESFAKVEDKSFWKPRCIVHKVFRDNFGLQGEQPPRLQQSTQYQMRLRGFSQCFLFILMKLLNVRRILSRLVGVFLSLGRDVIDQYFDTFLNRTLENILCQRRLAHIIRLGQGILFGKKKEDAGRKQDLEKQRELARVQLQTCFPTFVVALLGPKFNVSVDAVFEMLQSPQLNKQLLFNLFDLSIAELFPELVEDSAKEYT